MQRSTLKVLNALGEGYDRTSGRVLQSTITLSQESGEFAGLRGTAREREQPTNEGENGRQNAATPVARRKRLPPICPPPAPGDTK